MCPAYAHKSGMQTAAKLVFAALSFLILTSFLALPCLQGGGDLFVSLATPDAMSRTAPRIVQATTAPSSPSLPPLTPVPGLSAASTPRLILQSSVKSTPVVPRYSSVAPLAMAQAVQVSARIMIPSRNARSPMAVGGGYCADHKIFKPNVNVLKAFDALALTDNLPRLIVVLIVVLCCAGILRTSTRRSARPRPGWVRLRSLPFGATDPPRLAYFAAQRDA